ncbi:hypothetical protein BDA96_01G108200 [Sorghum bicolor]|uniref:Uncharacterized protein n=2 Tax=Sorghum bicolor TaxID=4558 RepID=A0A921RXQ5_SORBI|nr:hypothetical protein BDA96_01G108200 [Sorghum bicolor]OQU91055.1 hypothetical protein SORBI_3001G104050 [Sorghum bicolor]
MRRRRLSEPRGSHIKTATPRHTLMQRNRRTKTGRMLIRIRTGQRIK